MILASHQEGHSGNFFTRASHARELLALQTPDPLALEGSVQADTTLSGQLGYLD